jgi:hypothetical protein
VIALRWEWIALGYATYLAIVAASAARFRRARAATLLAAFAGWIVWATSFGLARPPFIDLLLPMPLLLAGYQLSGLFFIAPMADVERWLMSVDERVARRWPIVWPAFVRNYFELAYVLVYAVVPLGAVTLAVGGHADVVPRFWAVVLLAEFVSYGMLPWLQTRPPRALEGTAPASSLLRRFNLAVLDRGSIHVNTVPSGHAAGAVATALVVASVMPVAGGVFALLAVSITVATIVGRYHYAIDSVLGVIVAIAAWILIAAR